MPAANSQAWRRMRKSLKSPEYARLIAMLVAVRKKADIRQQELAKKLGKPQSFVAKYEGGERRIDLVEFVAIVSALGSDPVRLFGISLRVSRKVNRHELVRTGLALRAAISDADNFVIQSAQYEPQDCSRLAGLTVREERHCAKQGGSLHGSRNS